MNKSCAFCSAYNDYVEADQWCKFCEDFNKFTPNADWLEYIKLLDDQIAFREKTINDLYEKDCKIQELMKENEKLKEKAKIPKFAIIGANGLECLDPICEHCQNVDKRHLGKEYEHLEEECEKYLEAGIFYADKCEQLEKENEELKNLKDVTKIFAERIRTIFTAPENVPTNIIKESIKHAEDEYNDIKSMIESIKKYEVKENEELRAKLNPVKISFKVGDIITECDWAKGKTEDGKTYNFEMNNGQKVVCVKSELNAFVITEI